MHKKPPPSGAELLPVQGSPDISEPNPFRACRLRASETNKNLKSMSSAAIEIHMSRDRLARIEEGAVKVPRPDEVLHMSKAYGAPELCNIYCADYCEIGEKTVTKLNIDEFAKIALEIIYAMQNVEEMSQKFIAVAHDGKVGSDEEDSFKSIIDKLDYVIKGAQSLKLWTKKNLKYEPKTK